MSNSEHTPVRASAQRLTHEDDAPDGDPIEIQRLLAWYFRGEDPARPSGGERDLRGAA
ncbi:MAG: hypothetical protein QOI17_493 [Gaiellales bacterium]|jgi:hypothetical protein|nr:hypothetical protein [Gaiellales bacterium]